MVKILNVLGECVYICTLAVTGFLWVNWCVNEFIFVKPKVWDIITRNSWKQQFLDQGMNLKVLIYTGIEYYLTS